LAYRRLTGIDQHWLEDIGPMDRTNPLHLLRMAYDDFVACVSSLGEEAFLAPMGDWAPRDVVAHLVGWNRFMIQACDSILAGEPPVYYADAANNYAGINAALVGHYASRSKAALLEDLASSMGELSAYVAGLPPAALTTTRGVIHHSGESATVAKVFRSLAGDYQEHVREIRAWLAAR
jgi:hypothetical protein